MTDQLRAAAERIDRTCFTLVGPPRELDHREQLIHDAKYLARAVLAMLDPPDDVREAIERKRENEYVAGQAGNVMLAELLMRQDNRTIANHYLTLTEPIDD